LPRIKSRITQKKGGGYNREKKKGGGKKNKRNICLKEFAGITKTLGKKKW